MKNFVKTLVFVVLALSLTGCYAKKNTRRNVRHNKVTVKPSVVNKIDANAEALALDMKVDAVIDYAMKYLGAPYKYGGNGPKHFDCSGFTKYVFDNFGITLNRISADQLSNGEKIRNTKDLRRGDLVFFKGRDISSSKIGHVGIVTEVDKTTGQFSFIHVSSSSGVTVSKSTNEYYKKRYLTACRVIY